MQAYSEWASVYDRLTLNVPYHDIVAYLLEHFRRIHHTPGNMLDLACGTGNVMLEFLKKGYDIYGADGSIEMLTQAKDKCVQTGFAQTLLIQQKMENLSVYEPLDTVVCCLDSINHITDIDKIEAAFHSIYQCLRDDGCFVFDMNTIHKHENVLGNHSYIYDLEDIFCAWQNTYKGNGLVKVELEIFSRNENRLYRRSSDAFYERAYALDAIVDRLEHSGFVGIEAFHEMSFEPPRADSQRIQIICRK